MKIVITIEDLKPTEARPKNLNVTFTEFSEAENEPITHARLLCEYLDKQIDRYFEHFSVPSDAKQEVQKQCWH
jgi:hypothetical protein